LAEGTVKWFSNEKGYGLSSSAKAAMDVFVHFSAITMGRLQVADRGPSRRCRSRFVQGPKGRAQAANVQTV